MESTLYKNIQTSNTEQQWSSDNLKVLKLLTRQNIVLTEVGTPQLQSTSKVNFPHEKRNWHTEKADFNITIYWPNYWGVDAIRQVDACLLHTCDMKAFCTGANWLKCINTVPVQ